MVAAAGNSERVPWRPLSALEFLIGVGIVIGHNVFRVVPNEVPILFVLALVSTRVREGGWSALGFVRPASWTRTILIAVAAAATRLLLGTFAIDPLTSHFWPPAKAPSMAETIPHNPLAALSALGVVWTFAAFGEEVSYRGYLTKRAADLGSGSRSAWWMATILVSVLFGFGHFYKGPAGIVDSAVAGLILGAAYLLSGRNLWTAILAHGLMDTTVVVLLYFGLAD